MHWELEGNTCFFVIFGQTQETGWFDTLEEAYKHAYKYPLPLTVNEIVRFVRTGKTIPFKFEFIKD
jgi:hypothetical protein